MAARRADGPDACTERFPNEAILSLRRVERNVNGNVFLLRKAEFLVFLWFPLAKETFYFLCNFLPIEISRNGNNALVA